MCVCVCVCVNDALMSNKKTSSAKPEVNTNVPLILSCDVALASDATRGKQATQPITLTVRHEVLKMCFIACLGARLGIFVAREYRSPACFTWSCFVRKLTLKHQLSSLHRPSSPGALDLVYAASLRGGAVARVVELWTLCNAVP